MKYVIELNNIDELNTEPLVRKHIKFGLGCGFSLKDMDVEIKGYGRMNNKERATWNKIKRNYQI